MSDQYDDAAASILHRMGVAVSSTSIYTVAAALRDSASAARADADRRFSEFHSWIADITTRIGPVAYAKNIRQELEATLHETKFRTAPSKQEAELSALLELLRECRGYVLDYACDGLGAFKTFNAASGILTRIDAAITGAATTQRKCQNTVIEIDEHGNVIPPAPAAQGGAG